MAVNSQQTLPALLSEENPFSLVNLVDGEALRNAVKRVPERLWELSEENLREHARPTQTDYALRTALWNEFRVASRSGAKIKPARLYAGICSYTHWWANILRSPEKLAWILQPIQDYEKSLEPLLPRLTERYHELLNLNIYDKKGTPIPALVRCLLEAMKMIEYRVKGTAVQKVETKNLNLNIQDGTPLERLTLEEIDAQIAELEAADPYRKTVS